MKEIFGMHPLVRRILPAKEPEAGIPYRPIAFCVKHPVPEGLVLFNTLTKQYLFLEPEEAASVDERFPESTAAKKLTADWFLVPETNDDCKLADEVGTFFQAIDDKKRDGKLASYTILPTTDCNARCYYCYEAGCERLTMTDDTAHRVADYIAKRSKDDKPILRWFGGEPLIGMRAIDIICGDLAEKGFEYASTMTTNAYLFDDKLISKAINRWNLKMVQITLDGTENVYNATKAYTNAEGSPFRKVISNIRTLIGSGIYVSIRLNLSEQNYDDLNELTDYLLSALPRDKKNWTVYTHLLFDIECSQDMDFRVPLTELQQTLNDRIEKELGIQQSMKLSLMIDKGGCQATNGTTVVIGPRGELYPCEHFNECESTGTIDDDSMIFADLSERRKFLPLQEECRTCMIYPDCYRIRFCPVGIRGCIESMRRSARENIHHKIENEWRHYQGVDSNE